MTKPDARTIRRAIEVLSRVLNNADPSATVEIPVSELQRLHDCERETMRRTALPYLSCPRSRIDRDEDVALFIAERAGRLLLREIVEECESTFGSERTPSKSAIHRFIKRLRKVRE